MNKFRIDLILTHVLDVLGPVWLVLAIAVLLFVVFAGLVRALFATIFVLLCTQVWWRYLAFFAGQLRWVLFFILFVRGIIYLARTPAPKNEPTWARRLVVGLALLALASALWADSTEFTLELAISFCLGVVLTFGLLWRLADDPGVMPRIARAAVALALIVFGSGFAVAAIAYASGEYIFFDATKLSWGGRYSGVFYNPNTAGLTGAMLVPLIIAAPREFLGRIAWARIPALVVTLATIFLSGSRSALIGSAMAIVILAMYRYGAGALITVALGGLAVWALAVYAPLDDIDESAVGHIARTKHLSTLSGRVELWEDGWAAAQGHLVFGQGWGSSRNVGGGVDLERAIEMGLVKGATNLHNAHLQLLIDVGFVGVALFWGFCVSVLAAGWAILRAPRSRYNEMALVIFTSALGLIADTWVHGGIWSMGNPTTLVFWVLCVLTLKEGYRAKMETAARNADAAWTPATSAPSAV